jgi:thioredoxin-related protein
MRISLSILTIAVSVLLINTTSKAQDTTLLYDPAAIANLQIVGATANAKDNRKHVLLQIGGNWCKWCRQFDKWSRENAVVDSVLKADYVVAHINYSKENKNEKTLKYLGHPQRFGFPVFVIMDADGNRLHTQNSAYLEEGEGYSEKKVLEFLKHWNIQAVSDKTYEGKP